ncbi:hypothetical protein J3R74_003482 [Puniceicoccus vermicola]
MTGGFNQFVSLFLRNVSTIFRGVDPMSRFLILPVRVSQLTQKNGRDSFASPKLQQDLPQWNGNFGESDPSMSRSHLEAILD